MLGPVLSWARDTQGSPARSQEAPPHTGERGGGKVGSPGTRGSFSETRAPLAPCPLRHPEAITPLRCQPLPGPRACVRGSVSPGLCQTGGASSPRLPLGRPTRRLCGPPCAAALARRTCRLKWLIEVLKMSMKPWFRGLINGPNRFLNAGHCVVVQCSPRGSGCSRQAGLSAAKVQGLRALQVPRWAGQGLGTRAAVRDGISQVSIYLFFLFCLYC